MYLVSPQGWERMGLISLNTPYLFLGCMLLSTFGEAAVEKKTSDQSKCPADTLTYGSYCYQFFDDYLSWDESYSVCSILSERSSMVSIRDAQEMNALVSYIKNFSDECKVWVGLRKLGPRWRWVDGTRSTYGTSDFQSNDAHSYSNCAVMDTCSDQPQLLPEHCNTLHPFVCQFQP
ncbi:C-type lectin 1-like [Notamacropus eugenii]|uniref:C-type lectin 1-like n=1 Tax=Notamacropus eugenii TaxID=9315 RepID=UPI003B683680